MAITSAGRRKIYYVENCRVLRILCCKVQGPEPPCSEALRSTFWSSGKTPSAPNFRSGVSGFPTSQRQKAQALWKRDRWRWMELGGS